MALAMDANIYNEKAVVSPVLQLSISTHINPFTQDDQIAIVQALLHKLESNREWVLCPKGSNMNTACLIRQIEGSEYLDINLLSNDEKKAFNAGKGKLAAALHARGYTPMAKVFEDIYGLIKRGDPVNAPPVGYITLSHDIIC
jgi:hypothetical protein